MQLKSKYFSVPGVHWSLFHTTGYERIENLFQNVGF